MPLLQLPKNCDISLLIFEDVNVISESRVWIEGVLVELRVVRGNARKDNEEVCVEILEEGKWRRMGWSNDLSIKLIK
jgi:hypothetical protein